MGEDFADGTDRDNGGLGLGVAEDTGGDTAQRDAGGLYVLGSEQTGSVGGGQERLVLGVGFLCTIGPTVWMTRAAGRW